MLKNIHAMVENFGFSVQKRALHIHFSNESLNTEVFIQRIEGQHRINQGFRAEIICLSTNAHLALKQFIGGRVAVDQVTDLGQLSRLTGVITGASQGQSDGALTVYKLVIEDATALWHKRRNSRVFMNKSVREMTEIIFSEWQKKSALFAASLSLNLEGLARTYDVRPFTMQANESDYAFLTRLWRSEGINWLIDEAELFVAFSAAPMQAQRLRLIDTNQAYSALERKKIRFHRSHATERLDTITSFVAERFLQSTTIQTQRWQAQQLAQDQSNPLLSAHAQSEQQHNETLSLEQAWTVSSAWTTDLKGADQATTSNTQQLDQLNRQLNQYQELQAKYFTASSSVRDAQVGYWFELENHPEIDQHQTTDREFLILGKAFYNQNNLPKDILVQLEKLLAASRWLSLGDERQANELYVVRRQIFVVPEYDPLLHRPPAFPQRAKVVGPEGESIYVDAWGRIKVRFTFTRSDDHSHDGGAGSNDNDSDSAWVDVLTPWAGEGYGARFHPRIGEIVVIDFFEGDVDRPFVVGRIHEAERSQTMFDLKGQLPETKKLSGIRSQEVAGAGFNQLRFDDTTGQISTQLQSSHGNSQLNLGNLSHSKENDTSEGRGAGFELRSDLAGAIRSKGLYISTYEQPKAEKNQLEIKDAIDQLSESLSEMQILSEYAEKQKAEPADMLQNIEIYIKKIEEQWLELNAMKEAFMLIASPESIGMLAGKNIHLNALDSLTIGSGKSINLSSSENLILNAKKKASFFVGEDDLKVYTAKGKMDVQVQDNTMDLSSRLDLTITSSEGKVEINSPNEIVLKAKNSAIKIDGNGVTIITPQTFTSKASQHIFTTGVSVTPKLPIFPNNICWECLARRSSQRGAFVNKGDGL
ncbi:MULTISPECIES: type VI secretion system Vgr family protein [unclassified Acinetobacter]|uniref:type VI secretion system Vgr family protein n=1 Tax=unclassified Acinetobacter TaxID=196816 RepID=UPI0015D1958E|nr:MULTISPECIES: type VI secretion system Vgr family protein [unclassified Acinetobacter]